MNLLAIETASSVCGIALILEGKLAGIEEQDVGRRHSEKLPCYFDRLPMSENLILKELDGIAVSIGPGSFTGLRIGLSFAKGLAFSSDLPIAPVPTLEAMVRAASRTDSRVRCILHSHRDLVYIQDFSREDGRPVPDEPPFSARWEEAVKKVPGGALIYQYGCDSLVEEVHPASKTRAVPPSARAVAEVAVREFDRLKRVDFWELEPVYVSHLRPSKINQ